MSYWGGYAEFVDAVQQSGVAQTYGSGIEGQRRYLSQVVRNRLGIIARLEDKIDYLQDPTVAKDLEQKLSDIKNNSATWKRMMESNLSSVGNSNIRGVVSALDKWMGKIQNMSAMVQEAGTTIDNAAVSAQMAEDARNSITPEEAEQLRQAGEEDAGDYYFAQLKNEIYFGHLLDELSDVFGPDTIAEVEQKYESAKQAREEAENDIGTIINKASEKNPTIKKALDMADSFSFKEWWRRLTQPFSSLPKEWRYIIYAVGGLIGLYYSGKIIGGVKKVAVGLREKAQDLKAGIKKRMPAKNPYSSQAKFYHIRTEKPKKFKRFFTKDPGRKGHTKLTIGVPKRGGGTELQKIMVEKKHVPKSKRDKLKRMERRGERKPYSEKYLTKKLKDMGLWGT